MCVSIQCYWFPFPWRKGSVVTDFTVKVKSGSLDATALNSVNSNLPAALISIAPVIGSVTAKYYTIVCDNDVYGSGRTGDKATAMCPVGLEGHKSAVCQASGEWKLVEDSCIVTKINELLINSVVGKEIQVFSTNLSKVVTEEEGGISKSSATISAIVNILNVIAEVSKVVTKDVMKVCGAIYIFNLFINSDDAKDSWNFLNSNETQNSSSALLGSMETISNKLDGNFTLSSRRIQMGRSKFSNSFSDALTSNVSINLQNTGLSDVFITTIVFSTLHNIMPNETKPDNAINAAVLLVKLNENIRNVTLSYQKFNTTLELNPQCVFWNFSLLDNLGAWDDQGCRFVSDINDTVTCTCNHLTSFSILMSTAIPEELRLLLDIMTYIGVGISMISLIICLIIEGIVWRPLTKNSTAFMRHVAIVNTALSLLIADICFIIGAAISKNPAENPGEDYKVPVGPCSAATFFMHFFYLAMFFWMLVSSLLLLYRSVLVFSQMSKWTMFAIGLTVGYVCPLIIAVTTVAATAPGGGYVREDLACWLNWTKTKALLALVIPALAIVVFNILVILVVFTRHDLRAASRLSAHFQNLTDHTLADRNPRYNGSIGSFLPCGVQQWAQNNGYKSSELILKPGINQLSV
uniref:Uncharacterized protein n=1 Tax=Xiphophorus couchianus TaxID=32473 RepID=A0A3B5M164_9TELE